MGFLVLSWDEVYDLCIRLADKIRGSGFSPDVIVGIARGGWIPARVLSDLLDNPNVMNMRIQFYIDIGKTDKKPTIVQPLDESIRGKAILIVDDVADTGSSLRVAIEHAKGLGAREVRAATLHYKPTSSIVPDYYVEETSDWIVYPHERREFISKMASRLREEGRGFEEVVDEMARIGFPRELARTLLKESWR
ncbi:MAG: phosphoribosyltransferase [Candidatus Bathyarchaeia archaeon]